MLVVAACIGLILAGLCLAFAVFAELLRRAIDTAPVRALPPGTRPSRLVVAWSRESGVVDIADAEIQYVSVLDGIEGRNRRGNRCRLAYEAVARVRAPGRSIVA
jgi:hypothetical protein